MTRPDRVLFVFLDGVGLGVDDADRNPFADPTLVAFRDLAGGHPMTASAPEIAASDRIFQGIDATLGVEGLPQSGTGQAALFTGVNTAQLAGQHFGPYPPTAVHATLAASNVFRQIVETTGARRDELAFANAFPPIFFEHADARRRWTVTTRSCREAGVRLRTMEDLRAGEALAADLTNRSLVDRLGITLPIVAEETAAEHLADLAAHHRFTLFEYYLTDKAGHAQDRPAADAVLRSLDRFLAAVIDRIDLRRTLLLVTSDHGNLEDLATRSHTRHPVPLAAIGAGAGRLAGVRSLTDVTPALIALLR
jgi:hypothetical protein